MQVKLWATMPQVMVRKLVSTILCFCLVFSSAAGPFSYCARAQASPYNFFDPSTGQVRPFPSLSDYASHVEVYLQQNPLVREQLPPEALQQFERLTQAALLDTPRRGVNADLVRALENLSRNMYEGGHPEVEIPRYFFDGAQTALDAEKTWTYEQPVVMEGGHKFWVYTRNAATHQVVQSTYGEKRSEGETLLTIYKPKEEGSSESVVDAVARLVVENGKKKQVVVYSRSVEQMLQGLKTAFGNRSNDVWYTVDEHNNRVRHQGFPPEITAYLQKIEQNRAHLGSLDPKDLESIRQLALAYYDQVQADNLLKAQLALLIQHFVTTLNISKNPLSEQRLENLSVDQVRGLLQGLLSGRLAGYGTFETLMNRWLQEDQKQDESLEMRLGMGIGGAQGVSMAAFGAVSRAYHWGARKLGLGYTHLNLERDLTPELRGILENSITYSGYAVDAQRGALAAPTEEERKERLENAHRWIQLSQVEVQKFQMAASQFQLDGMIHPQQYGRDSMPSMTPAMQAQAEGLKNRGLALLHELERSEQQVETAIVRQEAAAFADVVDEVRFGLFNAREMRDKANQMIARAEELRSLYLYQQYRRLKGRGYASFSDFKTRIPQAVLNDLKVIDRDILPLLEQVKRGGLGIRAARGRLDRIAAQVPRLEAVLGISGELVLKREQQAAFRTAVWQSKLNASAASFNAQLMMFRTMNQLDFIVSEHLSERYGFDGTWGTIKDTFRYVINAGPGSQKAGEAAMRLFTRQAYDLLKSERGAGARRRILDLMSQGRYVDAMWELAQLDPQAAQLGREKWEKAYKDSQSNESDLAAMLTRSFMTKDFSVVESVAQDLFEKFNSGLKAYMGGTMAFGLVWTTILTAGIGSLVATPLRAAGLAVTQFSKAVGAAVELGAWSSRASAAANVVKMILYVPGKVLQMGTWLAGKALTNAGRNIINQLGLVKRTPVSMFKVAMTTPSVWKNALLFNLKNTVVIAGVGAAYQGGQYVFTNSSPYKSLGQAVTMGALASGQWASRYGFTFMASPFPTTAFRPSRGFAGTMSRGAKYAGEVSGPVGAVTQGIAKLAVKTAESCPTCAENPGFWANVAQAGPWGALMRERLEHGAAYRAAIRAAVWGGAMFDMSLKYMFASSFGQQLFEWGSYNIKKLEAHGNLDNGERLKILAQAHRVGMQAAMYSYLFVPIPPGYGRGQMKQARDMETGYLALRDSGKLSAIIENTGTPIEVTVPRSEMPWYTLFGFLGGNRRLEFAPTPYQKLRAAREILSSEGLTPADLLAIMNVPEQGLYRKYGREELLSSLVGELSDPALRETFQNSLEALGSGGRAPKEFYLIPEMQDTARSLLREDLGRDSRLREVILSGEEMLSGLPIRDRGMLENLREEATWAHLKGDLEPLRKSIREDLSSVVRSGQGMGKADLERAVQARIEERLKSLPADFALPEMREAHARILERLARELESDLRSSPGGTVTSEAFSQMLRSRLEKMEELSPAALKSLASQLEIEMAAGYQARKMSDHVREQLDRRVAQWRAEGQEVKARALERIASTLTFDILSDYAGEVFIEKALKGNVGDADKENLIAVLDQNLKQGGIRNTQQETITEFRSAQRDLIENFLAMLQGKSGQSLKRSLKAYMLLETGGGKTILAFVGLMPLAKALARRLGLKGVVYATFNNLLQRQALEDYKAFFNGRKPDFRITTYHDLQGEAASARDRGERSPYEDYLVLGDELDALALHPPTSIGQDNGGLTSNGFAGESNPLHGVLWEAQQEVKRLVEVKGFLERARRENLPEGETARDLEAVAQKYGRNLKELEALAGRLSGAGLSEEALAKELDGIGVRYSRRFNQVYRQVTQGEVPAIRYVRGSDGVVRIEPARNVSREVRRQFKSEARHAKNSLQLMFGGVEKFFVGFRRGGWQGLVPNFYRSALVEDPSAIIHQDASGRRSVANFHSDFMPTLETEHRNFFEMEGDPRNGPYTFSLPYEHVEVVYFKDVVRDAKYLIGFSGTISEGLRPFMEANGFAGGIVGRPTASNPRVLRVVDTPSEKIETIAGMAGEALRAEAGKKNLVVLLPRTQQELDALENALIRNGVTTRERIVRYFPDFVYMREGMYKAQEVAVLHNIEALEGGTADVVLLVPEKGGRGTNMPLKKYDGRLTMIGLDPHSVPTVTLVQAEGRLGQGRLAPGAQTEFLYVTDRVSLMKSDIYREVVRDRLMALRSGRTPGDPVSEGLLELAGGREKIRENFADPSQEDPETKIKGREFNAQFEAFLSRQDVRDFLGSQQSYEILVQEASGRAEQDALISSGIYFPDETVPPEMKAALLSLAATLGSWGLLRMLGVDAVLERHLWHLPLHLSYSMLLASFAGQGARALGNRFWLKKPTVPSAEPVQAPAAGPAEGTSPSGTEP